MRSYVLAFAERKPGTFFTNPVKQIKHRRVRGNLQSHAAKLKVSYSTHPHDVELGYVNPVILQERYLESSNRNPETRVIGRRIPLRGSSGGKRWFLQSFSK
jgi:hypothetical protein